VVVARLVTYPISCHILHITYPVSCPLNYRTGEPSKLVIGLRGSASTPARSDSATQRTETSSRPALIRRTAINERAGADDAMKE
jgi:hypothetical protein